VGVHDFPKLRGIIDDERDHETVAENLSHVVAIGSAALEQESQRAERFSNKATAQATLAGTWFAATQAVAIITLDSHTDRGWVIGVVVGLALQTIALCFLLRATARIWKLRAREDIGEATLEGLVGKATLPPEEFAEVVIGLYRHILYYAQEANDERADAFEASGAARLKSSSFWWGFVLLLGLAEIVTALLSRIV
jgi:hypothetical protein